MSATILIHPTASTNPAAVEALELATGRIAVLGSVSAELVLLDLEHRITTNYLRALDDMRALIKETGR